MTKPPKLIFLDFDGALFPTRFFITKQTSDPVLVEIINQLCENKGFKIVIISLAAQQGLEYCIDQLESAGIDKKHLFEQWALPRAGKNRSDSIAMFVKNLEITESRDFIIFDDQPCESRLVVHSWYRCDEESGLYRHDVMDLYGTYELKLKYREEE